MNEDIAKGKVIRSSIEISIRCDDLDRLIREVRAKLNGEEKQQNGQKKESGSNGEKVPNCGCGLSMVLRQNRKKNSWFWSCPKWTPQGDGCGMTFPRTETKEEEVLF